MKIKDLFVGLWIAALSILYLLGCIGCVFFVAIKKKLGRLS
jgi:hypothetical protein